MSFMKDLFHGLPLNYVTTELALMNHPRRASRKVVEPRSMGN